MRIIGRTDDSAGAGKRVFYTVELDGGVFVDVMNCVEDNNLYYAMQLQDGKVFYDKDGNSVDVDVDEQDVVAFVKDELEFDTTEELCPHCNYEQIIFAGKASPCPNCGEIIRPCSVCDKHDTCPEECPF